MIFNLLSEAPQGISEVPSLASVSGLYWYGAQQQQATVGPEAVGVHFLGPQVSPLNPPWGALQCGPPGALYCARSLGPGP